NDSRQKIDDEDSDEYSDYEIVEPEEQGKAKKKMGFRYEMKRKLINYKNRREKREHDEADDAEHPSLSGQDHHVLERTVSDSATNLRRSTELGSSQIRRHSGR
ncbi:hypothetical protein FOZ62_006820, partial [Perkinsus olseni]